MRAGSITPAKSFGFAMAAPMWEDDDSVDEEVWRDPEKLIWFVHGWGPDRITCIADAARRLRYLVRVDQEMSTLDMRLFGTGKPGTFVSSQNVDGTYFWGDQSWGGAVFEQMGDLVLAGAVGCLQEIEAHRVAQLLLSAIAQRIILGDGLFPKD